MATDVRFRLPARRIGPILLAGLMLTGVIALASAPTTTATASAATSVLTPVADSQVQQDTPTTNYGTSPTLRVDGSPVAVSYLKFDVQGLAAPPTKATLKVLA